MVVVCAAFVAVDNEDREIESILVRRRFLLFHRYLAGQPGLLSRSTLLIEAFAAALPQATAVGSVQATQGEAAAAERNPGAAVTYAESTTGKY